MSTRLQQVLRVGQARASATGTWLPKRQPVSTAVNGEDSDEDADEKWPPLPDWASNLEKEVKRLVRERDQAALMGERVQRYANTLEQRLKKHAESDTELRKSWKERLETQKEKLIKEKQTQLRQLKAELEKAQKEAEERENAWATKFAELGKRVEDAQVAAAKGAEAASLARDKMELEKKQVHAMVEALAVEVRKRAESEEEVAENMKKFADSQEELADSQEALARCLKRSAILEKLVKNQKEMLADKDALQKITELQTQIKDNKADEDEHDENLPELEPVTPPGSPPGSPPADPKVETKPENPAQSDTYDASFSEESVRKVAIEQIETKLDAITEDWPRRRVRTDKERRVQQKNYAKMYEFLMNDIKALNDTRNYALGVLTARIGHAYLKHITPLAFQASKFWEEEMAKRVRVAFFGMRYQPTWADTFSAFANIANKNAHLFATWYFNIETYIKKKRPGFKAFTKTEKPLHELLDMTRKLSTDKKIQYFASKEYDHTNHKENVYRMCEALPLFVNMLAWFRDTQDVAKLVFDSVQRSSFDPDMREMFNKLVKSIQDFAASIVAVQTIIRDPNLQPGEQIEECFAYLNAEDWVPIMKNTFFEGVRYNFDEEAYWSRKSGSL